MNRSFSAQHLSTPCRHHSALLLEARIGLSPTSTKIGFVCEEARMRSATQLLLSTRSIQEILDPQCLISLTINPEMRVKVTPGPAEPLLPEQGWRTFLIKVQKILADGQLRGVSFEVRVERSSWVALRILASSHTNPIFVLVGDRPTRASSKSAEWGLRGVDKCWAEKERFIKPDEMTSAKDAYEHARSTYRRLLAECQSSGPTSAEAKSGQ